MLHIVINVLFRQTILRGPSIYITAIPYVTIRNIEDFADQYILSETYLGVQHKMCVTLRNITEINFLQHCSNYLNFLRIMYCI